MFGLPVPRANEDPKRVVCDFVNTKLELNPPLLPAAIDVAHRVGAPTVKRTQTMLCKFVMHTDKWRIIKIRKILQKTGFGISDDIAKQHLDYMDALKTRQDVSEVWFFNGKVFLKPVGTKHACNPRLHCDIDKLIKDTLLKPPKD